MIKFSIPGKIHLMGEHTVVYGKPALFAAINLRTTVLIKPTSDKNSTLEVLESARDVIQKHFNLKRIPDFGLEIKSDIPVGAGLGSSAAVSAATIACILTFLKINWDLKLVNDLAYEVEKKFHGTPSGGDNTAVTYGGFLWYRKELESLKVFHSISQDIHPDTEQFVLINSGKPLESTAEMVAKVRIKNQESRIKVKKILDDQEELTKKVLTALLDGDSNLLIDSIKKGERNLEKLGVVGKKALRIIKEIEKIDGAAKILGGGGVKEGSGMILCFHKDFRKIIKLAKMNNWKFMEIRLGEEGLRKEAND